MKKLTKAVTIVAMLGMSTTPGYSASLYMGGDDNPTSPMACEKDAPPVAPDKAYDGVEPKTKLGASGATKVLFMPKLMGTPFFGSVNAGVEEAAKEWTPPGATTYDGPNEAKADQQITYVENYLAKGTDGIVLASNDGVALAPVLKKAIDKGVTVVTFDSDVNADARTWFVNQALHNAVAKSLIDSIANQTGGKGRFAIITSTFTTPVQARWIAEMGAYQAKCYPDMKWLETVEAQEDTVLSQNQANALINKYGNDIDGIISMTATASPPTMEAVEQAGLCEKIHVTGLALASTVAPYLKSGCAKDAYLWSTQDLGYAAAQVLHASITGTLKPGDKSVKAGRLGELKIVNGSQVLLGAPVQFTKDNVDNYKP